MKSTPNSTSRRKAG